MRDRLSVRRHQVELPMGADEILSGMAVARALDGDQVVADELIHKGWVEEHTPEGRDYLSLRLTSEGRSTVQGRYPR